MSMCGGVSAPCHPALSKPLFQRVGARLAKPRDVGKRLQAPTALLSHSLRVDRSLWSVGRGNVLLAATAIGGFRRLCDRISSAGLAHMKTKAIRTQGSANRRGQGNQQRWSARVMKTSNALDLEPGVFTQRSPRGSSRGPHRACSPWPGGSFPRSRCSCSSCSSPACPGASSCDRSGSAFATCTSGDAPLS